MIGAPIFSYCGVNRFGPFLIRERRSDHKKYGAMLTYLVSLGVNIEVLNQIETDSFLQVLRRMIRISE